MRGVTFSFEASNAICLANKLLNIWLVLSYIGHEDQFDNTTTTMICTVCWTEKASFLPNAIHCTEVVHFNCHHVHGGMSASYTWFIWKRKGVRNSTVITKEHVPAVFIFLVNDKCFDAFILGQVSTKIKKCSEIRGNLK